MQILALSPHTDDIELGCGASLNRWYKEGHHIYTIIFSSCGIKDLVKENKDSLQCLGCKKSLSLDYTVRQFTDKRQEILDHMIDFSKKLDIDLVLTPSSNDKHQDHQVITQEAKRAFFDKKILGYELPWNCTEQRLDFGVKISEEDLQAKLNALNEYKSQKHRSYFDPEFIRGLAKVRGTQWKVPYAEAFETIRYII